MEHETILTLAGVVAGACVCVDIGFVLHKIYGNNRKKEQTKNDKRYETIALDDGTFVIPKTVHNDDYNKYVNGYDIHIRENFEQYIKLHVQEWWDEYENSRRKELAPLSRTICKYVKVAPVRLKGSWSTDWYAYVKHGAFKVKVRYINWFDEDANMEMKITNTNITEDDNGN